MYVCIYVCAMHAYMHLTIVNLIFVISFLKMTACPPGTFNEGKGFNCSGTSIYFFVYLFCLLISWQNEKVPHQNRAGTWNLQCDARYRGHLTKFLTSCPPIRVWKFDWQSRLLAKVAKLKVEHHRLAYWGEVFTRSCRVWKFVGWPQ